VPSTIFGDEPLPVDETVSNALTGFATSRGHYVGPVRVVQGLRDFDTVQDGDVLTVPFTDIGWSPLFSKAGAVIAESGGLLSHSSILAREYGIPCIVSVSNACQLQNGTLVAVDGFKGKITVL
jgi:pyruvate,water dikinase